VRSPFSLSLATHVSKTAKRGAAASSLLLTVLAMALAVMTLGCALCDPAPIIDSISPMSATAGGSQFLLTLKGRDFEHGARVSWNGSLRGTTSLSHQELVASIPATDIAQPGTALVVVVNPPSGPVISGGIGVEAGRWCNAKTSNGVTFTINP
jgi:hypothetical protein